MATKAVSPNPYMYHVTLLRNKTPPQSHSFGYVSLPTNPRISLSERSLVSSVMSPAIGHPLTTTISITTTSSTTIRKFSDTKNHCANISLANVWREVQGCNNWKNLIDPLHPLLQQEIARYGNFVDACYRAFDLDPNSKRYLNCKFGKKTLLKEAGIENSDGYQVTKYIYATPDININIPTQKNEAACGRWIGYVAVSSDESVKRLGRRDILVTFRGTVTNPEWMANFMSSLTPARLDPHNPRPDVKVESGFLSLYTSDESQSKFGLESCRQQLLSEVSRLLHRYKGEELSITLAGHSMGSSLALLLAYDISELGMNRINSPSGEKKVPVTVFSFAGPRVGNLKFKERCEELGAKVLRIVNVNDPIPKLPGVLFNENFRVLGGKYEMPWSYSCYAHVGVELALDFFNVQNPTCVHDLESYIKLLECPSSGRSSSVDKNDEREGASAAFFGRARQVTLSNRQLDFKTLQWRIAVTNVVNLIGSVSNQMLYYNLF